MKRPIAWLRVGVGSLLLAQISACGSVSPTSGKLPAASQPVEAKTATYVYQCDGHKPFTVWIEGGKAWLFMPSATIDLPRVRSASGAKYGEGHASYWSQGEHARFVLDGQTYTGCRNNRALAVWEDAKLRGVDFRAVGNEPGWHLEIFERDRVLFTHNYGQDRYEFAASSPQTDQAARMSTYHLGNDRHHLLVTLKGEACSDTMSGEGFATRVTIVFDGRRLSGCGRALH